MAVSGAAAVTERIRLLTSVLLTPLRSNTPLLAKQAASVATDEGMVQGYLSAFEDAAATIVLFPCSADVEQVDLLADAVGDGLR